MTNKSKSFTSSTYSDIQSILDKQSDYLLGHECTTVSKYNLHLPSPNFIDDTFI